MKRLLQWLMLGCWLAAMLAGFAAFGGVALENALPFLLLCLTLALLWAIRLLLVRPVSWGWSPMHLPVLAFTLYAVARYFTAAIEYDARVELVHVLLYTLVYFTVATNFYRSDDRTFLIWALGGLAFLQVGYGMWQFATNSDHVLGAIRALQYRGRASGTYICPNHLGGFLELVFGLLLARLVVHRAPRQSLQRTFLQKLLELYLLGVILAGLYATQSRGAWIGVAVAIVVALLWMWRAQALPPRMVDVMLLLIVVAGVVVYCIPSVRNRFGQVIQIRLDYTFDYRILDIHDPHFNARGALSRSTVQLIRDYPLTGTGPGSWQWFFPQYRDPTLQFRPRYAHNDVLHLAADYGLIGVLLVLTLLGCFFWRIVHLSHPARDWETRAIAIGAASAILALLVHSFVDFNLHIPVNAFLFVTILGLVAAINDNAPLCRRTPMSTATQYTLALGILTLVLLIGRLVLPICRAEQAIAAGNAARADRDWDAARQHYDRAILADPRNPEAHIRRADLFRSLAAEAGPGRRSLLETAIAGYRQALELNPRHVLALLRLGAALDTLGDTDQALATYQAVLTLDPHYAGAWTRTGELLERLGQLTEARTAFAQAAKLGNTEAAAALRRLK